MAHSSDVKHDYHLVNPSPWPFTASVSVLFLAIGGVVLMKGLSLPSEAGGFGATLSNLLLVHGQPWLFLVGALGLAFTLFGWWGDVIKEGRQGDHTPVVDLGLRYGMILFIASEVMFFVAWFWAFFELAIFHDVRANWYVPTWDEATAGAWANWPPPNVETFDPFHLPLMNTLILLLSGTTVTWAHHALQQGDRKGARNGLLLTVLLGVGFTALQAFEYAHAGFAFGNQGSVQDANLYGATFFMATGFHGFHVIVGTLFLFVCLVRLISGGFTPQKHFGLEAAAWYWHFVDVVWLFLFAFVYVTPYLVLGG
jgi:cytochrome c oxidase subunit III